MTKEKIKKEGVKSELQMREFSIVMEPMMVGDKLKTCLIVKLLDKEANKYVMFQSTITKTSILGEEIDTILKEAKKVLKDSKKKK